MGTLFDAPEPYDTGHLEVSGGHRIYYEQVGNPEGKPAVFVHGGPGGATNAACRRFWDPAKYRVVLFHQRGCGLSTPYASVENNTTWDLVADMERIREHLSIERWQVFGGSWGSTLSLAYAITHPERATELILRGIFLVRDKELRWYYQDGASRIFPDIWEGYLAPIPEAEHGDLMAAYHKRLMGDDEAERLRCAQAWSGWEGATSRLHLDPALAALKEDPHFALAFARIENHYFVNKGFFESDGWLLTKIDRIRSIPGVIVQGRYDIVTPMDSAWALHRAWPEAELVIEPDAGHSMSEPGIASSLVDATERFSTR